MNDHDANLNRLRIMWLRLPLTLILILVYRFFISHDREFHVASLNYKPDFKVMPEGWDGTIKDMDEVHYEISKKEDDMLYEEFVRRFEFNKMKVRPFFCPLEYALT